MPSAGKGRAAGTRANSGKVDEDSVSLSDFSGVPWVEFGEAVGEVSGADSGADDSGEELSIE